MGETFWTPEHDATIRRMADEGCTVAEVVEQFEREKFKTTRGAVIGRGRRMRPPVKWQNSNQFEKMSADRRRYGHNQAVRALKRIRKKPALPSAINLPSPETFDHCTHQNMVTISELGAFKCPWPMWEHYRRPLPLESLYCGDPKDIKAQYCPHHTYMAWRGSGPVVIHAG